MMVAATRAMTKVFAGIKTARGLTWFVYSRFTQTHFQVRRHETRTRLQK